MINHIIEYYKIPHPFDKSKESVAISDPGVLSERCFRVWVDDKKSTGEAHIPRILRVLISPDKSPDPADLELVKRFESNFKIQEDHRWGILKLRFFLRFTTACAIGYFIYWTIYNFPWFWAPATIFLESILGDTMNKIFQGVVISLVPGLSFIKNFVGAKRWTKSDFHSKYTKIFSRFGESSREYFAREIKKCLKIIKETAREEKVLLETGSIEDMLEEILRNHKISFEFARDWSERFERILEELSERAKKEPFLEGVVVKLDRLRDDLLCHYFGGFQIVPLKIATKNSLPEDFFPSFGGQFNLLSSILAKGFIEKAKNLKEFLDTTSHVRDAIYSSFNYLEEVKEKEERVKLLENIEEGFESLRNIVGNFHFGDNPYVPHERGNNLNNLYDRLYHLFGEAKLDILEGKRKVKGVFFRHLRIKSERAQRRRIKKLKLDVERLLCQGVKTKRVYEKVSHFLSFFGANLKRSILFSGIVFFIFASLLSFKVLAPGQVLTATHLRWGVKERATQKVPLFSRGVRVYRFGQGVVIFPGKELFWQMPLPFVFTHKIDFNKSQEFSSYMIFSAPTDTFYKKGLRLLAGIYGGYYQVVEITFEFVPKDREAWIRYDYDGKGCKRLRRDIAPVIDEWRGELFTFERSPLLNLEDKEEMRKIFSGSFFKKLWKDGRMREIIKSQIFKSPLMTYQYGTYPERIEPGIDLILRSLKRERTKLELADIPEEEKEKRIKRIEEFEGWVEKTKEDALKMAKEEYSVLRKRPEELKKYISDPDSISELKSFEAVWYAIRETMLYEYATEKFIKIMKGKMGKEKKKELLQMLIEKIEENPYFVSHIKIRDVRAKVIFMDSFSYRSLVSKITEEVI